MMNNGPGFGWGMGFFNPLLSMLLILLIVGAVFFFIFYMINRTNNEKKYSSQSYDNDALKILKERYARGEIDDEEYERRKNIVR